MRFWQDMTKANVLNPNDKLMVGVNATGETQYIDVSQIQVDTSAFVKKTGGNTIAGAQAFTGSVTMAGVHVDNFNAAIGTIDRLTFGESSTWEGSGNISVDASQGNLFYFNGSGELNLVGIAHPNVSTPMYLINIGSFNLNIIANEVFQLPGNNNIVVKPNCVLEIIGISGKFYSQSLGSVSDVNFTQALADKLNGIPADIGDQLYGEEINRQQADNSLAGLINQEATTRSNSDQTILQTLAAHTNNTSNPHSTTLEQARAQNNILSGNINANGNKVIGLANPTADQDASTKNYADSILTSAKAYSDGLVTSTLRIAGNWDASVGTFPTSGTGAAGIVRAGDQFRVSVAGTIQGIPFDIDDNFYALINVPGQSTANWQALEHNTSQATESARGTAMIVDAVTIANENSLDDTKFITTKKLWLNFWTRITALSWTWQQKQIFNAAPRLASVSPGQYVKTDGNKDVTGISIIPGADMSPATQTTQGAAQLATTAEAIAGTNDTKIMTPAKVTGLIVTEANARSSADTSEAQARADADTVLSGQIGAANTAINANAAEIAAHEANTSNPHHTGLEQVRTQNNQLAGNIDANGNQIDNLATPSTAQQASTKAYTDNVLTTAKAYADSLVGSAIRVAGSVDASSGNFPTVGTGAGGAVLRGDQFVVSVAGIIQGIDLDKDDTIYSLTNNPGQIATNWHASEHNVNQATETTRGVAMVIDAVTVANESTLDDAKFVTSKKLWVNFWGRVTALSWTWAAKQIFTISPRLSSLTAGHYLKLDSNKDAIGTATIPAADIVTDANNRFISDARITKLDGIATGATANSSDATLLSRTNHTGTQTASTISDFTTGVLATLLAGLSASSGLPLATDNILAAMGKVLYFMTNIAATIRGTTLTGLSTASNTVVVDTDTILVGVGKLQAQITPKLTGTAATDAETQISAAVSEDNKFVSRSKLFNWWTWVKVNVISLTNTTDSTSQITGSLVTLGGIGVAKNISAQSLMLAALAGTGTKIGTWDISGNAAAPFTVISPLLTDATTINLIITETNWTDAGVYIGTAITAAFQNQVYKDAKYLYWFYDATTPIRMSINSIMHIKGNSGVPSVIWGNGVGTSPTATSISGNDLGFNLTFTTGSTGLTMNGVIATVTFNKSYQNTPRCGQPGAKNAISATTVANVYNTTTTTTLTFAISGILMASTVYSFDFVIVN